MAETLGLQRGQWYRRHIVFVDVLQSVGGTGCFGFSRLRGVLKESKCQESSWVCMLGARLCDGPRPEESVSHIERSSAFFSVVGVCN